MLVALHVTRILVSCHFGAVQNKWNADSAFSANKHNASLSIKNISTLTPPPDTLPKKAVEIDLQTPHIV